MTHEKMRVQVVMANFNEWTPQWDNYCAPLAEFEGDLAETKSLLVSSDDWRTGPTVEKYRVVEVELPSWLVQGWWEYFLADGAPDREEAYRAAVSRSARCLCGHEARDSGLRWLAQQNGGKFASSLKDQWADVGRLTEKQAAACKPFRGGR
jgi:hypothetical protein